MILASFLHFQQIAVEKIAVTQERIELLVWNFQVTCRNDFFLLNVFSRGGGRYYTPSMINTVNVCFSNKD